LAREEGAERAAARPLARGLPRALALEGRPRRRRSRRPPRARLWRRLFAVARARIGSCRPARPRPRRRGLRGRDPRGMSDDCLFCALYREGDHVAAAAGFVAIRDINPQASTHLLVIPERHIDSFHDIGEFPPEEAKRMLDFVAEV